MSRKGNKVAPRYGSGLPSAQRGVQRGADPLLAQAEALCQRGRLDEAEALARGWLASSPRDHAALHIRGIIARQKGDSARAIDLFRQAIAISARVPGYHGNLGNVYFETAQFGEAARCYRKALALDPASAPDRFGLGLALMAQKAYAAAVKELAAALKLRPNHEQTHLNLGIALTELGRIDQAITHCQRAVALGPGYPGNYVALAVALRTKGELRNALAQLARAAEMDPEYAEAYYELVVTFHVLDWPDEAERALRQGLALRPARIEELEKLGKVLIQRAKFDDAMACYERMKTLAPQSALPLRGIGYALHFQGRFAEARAAFATALELEPEDPDTYAKIGRTYWSEGRFAEAIAWHEKAIARQPDNAEAHYTLAMMRSSREGKARIHELKQRLTLDSLSFVERVALHFALAKLYDEDGDYDAAFGSFKAGNDLYRSQNPFWPETETAYVDRVIGSFSKELFAEKGRIGSESERPVFIVGLPRSGTTLVEQILASHPQVHGHGELVYFQQLTQALPEQLGGHEPYPECMRALDAETAQRIAAAHLARLERDAGTALRSVDKLPDNFSRLGLIVLLFPRAKLIHCMRDPLDTCLSCYFQDFGERLNYTCDLEHLGRYYRDYQRLMAHWHAALPSPILDVPYEGLVADQEAWSRKLIDFLGLPWDERCLAYYKTERPVLTSSAWQVRQPIYTSSIGRWRHYAGHLGPLFGALGITLPPN